MPTKQTKQAPAGKNDYFVLCNAKLDLLEKENTYQFVPSGSIAYKNLRENDYLEINAYDGGNPNKQKKQTKTANHQGTDRGE